MAKREMVKESPDEKLARERKMAVALAKENGLKETARVIAKARCFNKCPNIPDSIYLSFSDEHYKDAAKEYESYQEIFDTATKEGGADKLLEIIAKIGDVNRVFEFASRAKGFKKRQMDYLISIVSRTKNVHLAGCFFDHVKGLTKGQVDDLIRILKEDSDAQYACGFLCHEDKRRLKRDQINCLVSIIFNDIDSVGKASLCLARDVLLELLNNKRACERLTKKQRARLRAIEEQFDRRLERERKQEWGRFVKRRQA